MKFFKVLFLLLFTIILKVNSYASPYTFTLYHRNHLNRLMCIRAETEDGSSYTIDHGPYIDDNGDAVITLTGENDTVKIWCQIFPGEEIMLGNRTQMAHTGAAYGSLQYGFDGSDVVKGSDKTKELWSSKKAHGDQYADHSHSLSDVLHAGDYVTAWDEYYWGNNFSGHYNKHLIYIYFCNNYDYPCYFPTNFKY